MRENAEIADNPNRSSFTVEGSLSARRLHFTKIKLGQARPLRDASSGMKLKPTTALPTLQKGQLWKTRTAHVEIMNVGKLLAHYRLFAVEGQKRVPTTMERVRVIQDYLAAKGGKLIRNERPRVLD